MKSKTKDTVIDTKTKKKLEDFLQTIIEWEWDDFSEFIADDDNKHTDHILWTAWQLGHKICGWQTPAKQFKSNFGENHD